VRWLGLTLHCRYDLYATVNHMGSIDGGHYVAHMQVMHTRTFTHALSPVLRASHGLCMLTSAAADGQQLVLR
jgi:ubiquitin C-terminal hydrolase